jgi:hypothetical protein
MSRKAESEGLCLFFQRITRMNEMNLRRLIIPVVALIFIAVLPRAVSAQWITTYSQAGGEGQPTVTGQQVPSEIGLLLQNPNGFAESDAGAVLFPAKSPSTGAASGALKIMHGRFHIFMPADDTQWSWFPYSSFVSYAATEASAGHPLLVTATYGGTHRPVYFLPSLAVDGSNRPTVPSSEWRQLVKTDEPLFINWWVTNYVRTLVYQQVSGQSTLWSGLDECYFLMADFGVIDDSGVFHPVAGFDSPFPQNETQLLAMFQSFFTQLKSIAPDIPVMPTLASGISDRMLTDPSNFAALYQDASGVMVENIYTPSTDDFVKSQFFANLTNLYNFAAGGKTELLRANIPVSGSTPDATASRTSLIIYLLMRGNHSFYAPNLGLSPSVDITAENPTDYEPIWNSIGNPTGTLQSAQIGATVNDRLYSRITQNGIVYLNWTGASQVVTLPPGSSYTDRNGNSVTTLTIPDTTGDYALLVGGPHINSFNATPGIITAGATSTLSWNVTGATALSINQGFGTVTGTSVNVSPTATTTYTLTATNASGSVQSQTTVTVSTGLVGYWMLDDGSGTAPTDSSGNGHTMSLVGSPAWQTTNSCVINGCLAFNGTSQAGSASAINLSATNVVTVAFWMKWTAFANDNRVAIEFSSNFNNSITGFLILPDDSQSGMFQAGVKGNTGYNQVNFTRPSAGTWHHYAFVMNKANPAATEVIPYVDGKAVSYTKPYSSENTNAFAIDNLYFMSRNKSSLWGAGSLDDVRIYSRSLSASEIAALATRPPQGSSETAPITYSLGDLNWTSATTGLGTVRKNESVLGNVLTLNGKTYTEGIGTNANSTIVYNLGGNCSTFETSAGIDDEVSSGGIITVQVVADGTTLYSSPMLTPTSGTRQISVSVAGKKQLSLVVTDDTNEKYLTSDNADWANPTLSCSVAPPAVN